MTNFELMERKMMRKILGFVFGAGVTIAVWMIFCAIADCILELKADTWRMLFGWVGGSVAVFLGAKSRQLFQAEQPLFKPDEELDEYYRKAKFFNTKDFDGESEPQEDKKLTLLRFKDHTGLEHDLKFDDEGGEAIILFIETREIWLGKKIKTEGSDK